MRTFFYVIIIQGDNMRELGNVRAFSNGNYEVIENNIIPKKGKKKFMIKLNVYTLLLFAVGTALIVILFPRPIEANMVLLAILCFGFLPFIVIHELLHGFAFILFNKGTWNDLKFGLVLKSGVAYCISLIPVKVHAARLSLMMPLYAFCFPMIIIGIVTSNFALTLFGFLYATGSTGDIYYMWKLRKSPKESYMFEEMPTKSGYEIGYLLYKKLD